MQSSVSNQLEGKFKQLLAKMAKTIGVQPGSLTKVQQTVVFSHFVNIQFGLEPINRKGECVVCPEGWDQASEGVYKINYRLKSQDNSKKDNASNIIQFRFVDNQQEDGRISVNYSLEDSQQLHQFEIRYQKQKIEDIYKSYLKNLEQKLKNKKEEKSTNSNIRNLEPVWREPPNYQQPNFPMPLIHPGHNQGPFTMPFRGGEYIGPDNQIFKGRGTNNPLEPFDPNPRSINDPRRPIGSRHDPIDPFGSQGVDEPGTRDFRGFNQFGKPIGGNKGGFGGPGPNRFL